MHADIWYCTWPDRGIGPPSNMRCSTTKPGPPVIRHYDAYPAEIAGAFILTFVLCLIAVISHYYYVSQGRYQNKRPRSILRAERRREDQESRWRHEEKLRAESRAAAQKERELDQKDRQLDILQQAVTNDTIYGNTKAMDEVRRSLEEKNE